MFTLYTNVYSKTWDICVYSVYKCILKDLRYLFLLCIQMYNQSPEISVFTLYTNVYSKTWAICVYSEYKCILKDMRYLCLLCIQMIIQELRYLCLLCIQMIIQDLRYLCLLWIQMYTQRPEISVFTLYENVNSKTWDICIYSVCK